MTDPGWLVINADWEPFDVTCARCGKVLPVTEAIVEEGDEWECPPCNERENARERAELLQGKSHGV